MPQPQKRIPKSFFTRSDVLQVSRELLGQHLITEIDGQRTIGRIVETEAYHQDGDKACHAYGGRRTKRTEVMFMEGGHAYVYLCYGIHHLFNIVTGKADVGSAVLIRALEPVHGQPLMLERRGMERLEKTPDRRPGHPCSGHGHHEGVDRYGPHRPTRPDMAGIRRPNTVCRKHS